MTTDPRRGSEAEEAEEAGEDLEAAEGQGAEGAAGEAAGDPEAAGEGRAGARRGDKVCVRIAKYFSFLFSIFVCTTSSSTLITSCTVKRSLLMF